MATNSSDGCPYKGLQPYTEEDREYFFGRERDRETVASNLFAAPLTILYGASGVGKSSVLQAGAIPQLRETPRVIVLLFSRWQDDKFDLTLKNEVLSAVSKSTGKERAEVLREVGKVLELEGATLLEKLPLDYLLAGCARAFGRRLLIIFDQFEEYFLYHAPTTGAEGFDAEFARAVNQQESGVNFMLSMREEELSKLDRFRPRIPNLLSNLLRLENLDRAGATSAIREPLRVYNEKHKDDKMGIDDDLVTAIIDEVKPGHFKDGGPSQVQTSAATSGPLSGTRIETPFLQLVLIRLWEAEKASKSHMLRLSTFEELGGALEIARTHLDKVMDQLSDSQRATAASVLRFLVTPSGSKIAQEPAALAAFSELSETEVQSVLSLLGSGREMNILRKVSVPGQAVRYELFHDVLGPAILEWRARYVQAQQLVKQRAQVERAFSMERQRRMRQALVVLVVLLLLMAGATVYAFQKRAQANQNLGEAVQQRSEAMKQEGIAKKALEEAKRAQDELQRAKTNVEQERDNTKEQARLLKISEQSARVSEQKAIKAKGEAVVAQHTAETETDRSNRQATVILDAARIMDLDLYGFDATRAGNMDQAIDYFGQALTLSRKAKNASSESYALLNVAESYAAKSGTLPTDVLRIFDSSTDETQESPETNRVILKLYLEANDPKKQEESKTNRTQAISFFEEAIGANDRLQPPDLKRRASIHQRMGDVYLTGEMQAAVAAKEGKDELNLDKVVESYSKASEDYRQAELHNEEAVLLSRIGFLLTEFKDKTKQPGVLEKTISFYERALTAFSQAKKDTKDDSERAELESKEASVLVKLGNIYKESKPGPEGAKKAISYYEQAVPVYNRVNQPEKAGDNYSTIGDLYSDLKNTDDAFDNFAKARKAFQKAEAVAKDANQKTALETKAMLMLHQIGGLYKEDPQGRAKLQAYYDSVIDEYRNDFVGKATALHSIGDLFGNELNDKSKAIDYYTRERQAWQQAGKRLEEGNALLRIGEVYNSIHDPNDKQKILESFDQARSAYNQIEAGSLKLARTQVVNNLITIAKFYAEQGEKRSALEAYDDALVIYQKRAADEPITGNYRISEVIQAGSKIIGELKKDEQEAAAATFFQKVFGYYQAVKDVAGEGAALEAAGKSYDDLGNKKQAIAYYKQARESYQKRNYYYQFDVLKKIAKLYFALNDQSGAASYFQEVLESYRIKSDVQGEGSALVAIGASYSEAGKKQEAIGYYEQALQARIKVNDRNGQLIALRALITIYKDLGQTEKADELSKQADALQKAVPKK
jgi:tetratricopeptide (TPR) repeat protein